MEGKIHRLPVVEKHRTPNFLILAANQMFPVKTVNLSGQCPIALTTKSKHHFRRGKTLPCCQCIQKTCRMNPHHKARLVDLVEFCRCKEISAVHQTGSEAFTIFLIGRRFTKNHKGILLVAGSPAHTVHGQLSMTDFSPFGHPLHRMPSIKRKQIQIIPAQIQTGRERTVKNYRFFPMVSYLTGPGNRIILRKHAIIQDHFRLRSGILKHNLQGLGFCFLSFPCVIPQGRQPGQGIFSGQYLMGYVNQFGGPAPVGMFDFQTAFAVIPCSKCGIFLRTGIQGISPILEKSPVGRTGKPAVHPCRQVIHGGFFNLSPIINMQ